VEKPSLIVMAHLEIGGVCTCYNANNTLCIKNTCEIERRGPSEPFATQAMLTQ